MPTIDDEQLRGMRELIDGLYADQAAAHAMLDQAGVGERGAKLEVRIARLLRLHAELLASAAATERERCARIAETAFGPGLSDRDDYWQPRIAAAIRAQE